MMRSMSDVLDSFTPVVSSWFRARFGAPTEAQERGWREIAAGRDTLILAPTGSGKTRAAFLAGIDARVRRAHAGALDEKVRILYVSPLKALSADVARNLDQPLREIEAHAPTLGRLLPPIRTAVRSGDTTQNERAKILRHPPHVLITTPESLYLMLTSPGGQAVLKSVETVIVDDEIHALAGQKRGAHLALSLERLDALVQSTTSGRPWIVWSAPAAGAAWACRPRSIPSTAWPIFSSVAMTAARRARAGSSTAGGGARSTWPSRFPKKP